MQNFWKLTNDAIYKLDLPYSGYMQPSYEVYIIQQKHSGLFMPVIKDRFYGRTVYKGSPVPNFNQAVSAVEQAYNRIAKSPLIQRV